MINKIKVIEYVIIYTFVSGSTIFRDNTSPIDIVSLNKIYSRISDIDLYR